jgi:hypothetical protein
MATAISSRRRAQRRHLHDKSVIDHLVRFVHDQSNNGRKVHAPLTASGLTVEGQVRKVWHRSFVGLALF